MDSNITDALRTVLTIESRYADRRSGYLRQSLDLCDILEDSGWNETYGSTYWQVYSACIVWEAKKDGVIFSYSVPSEAKSILQEIFYEGESDRDNKERLASSIGELGNYALITLLAFIANNLQRCLRGDFVIEDGNIKEFNAYFLWAKTISDDVIDKCAGRLSERVTDALCEKIDQKYHEWVDGNASMRGTSLDWYYSLEDHLL